MNLHVPVDCNNKAPTFWKVNCFQTGSKLTSIDLQIGSFVGHQHMCRTPCLDNQDAMTSMQGSPRGTVDVLNFLDGLPREVVESSVWSHLPAAAKASWRQANRQSQMLLDQLVVEARLTDSSMGAIRMDNDAHAAEEQPEAWHQATEQRSTYLSKLPCLTCLELSVKSWPSPTALVLLLTRYGEATCGRLKELLLLGRPLCAAASSAIRSACPDLQRLRLCTPREDTSSLSGDPLLPLRSLPLLMVRSHCITFASGPQGLFSCLPCMRLSRTHCPFALCPHASD